MSSSTISGGSSAGTISRYPRPCARAPGAPARARARAVAFLSALPPRALDDVELVLNELVTNAVRHGEGRALVKIHRSDDHVRVEVADEGEAAPEGREAGIEGGWGLLLVNAVARNWGASQGARHVWCEIAL